MLMDGRQTDDGRTTDARVIGILIAHLGAFGSGELKMVTFMYQVGQVKSSVSAGLHIAWYFLHTPGY